MKNEDKYRGGPSLATDISHIKDRLHKPLTSLVKKFTEQHKNWRGIIANVIFQFYINGAKISTYQSHR